MHRDCDQPVSDAEQAKRANQMTQATGFGSRGYLALLGGLVLLVGGGVWAAKCCCTLNPAPGPAEATSGAAPSAPAPAEAALASYRIVKPWGRITAPPSGKPGAPVSVDAEAWSNQATVQVTFLQPVVDVTVAVSGPAGLSNPTPIRLQSFAGGTTAEFALTYDPADTKGELGLSISGVFAGRKSRRVVSFEIPASGGPRPLPRHHPSVGKVGLDAEGARIVDMPATRVE